MKYRYQNMLDWAEWEAAGRRHAAEILFSYVEHELTTPGWWEYVFPLLLSASASTARSAIFCPIGRVK